MIEIKVLLAEDDLNRARKYEWLISQVGPVKIDTVYNGEDLVERARNGGYVLIVTDNEMPNLNGVDAIRQIRQFDQHTPIILHTSGLRPSEEELQGATHFLEKPHPRWPDYDELTSLVRQYIIAERRES